MRSLWDRTWVVVSLFGLMALAELTYFVSADVAYNKVAAPPLDDTFIHFQYAKQIARGRFFRYQDGDQVSTGATSFLYPVVLAPFWAMGLRGVSLIWAAHLLNALALALAMIFVWSLLRRLTEDRVLALFGGLAVGFNGWFMWGVASGMAVAMTAAALAAAVWAVVLFVQEGRRLPAALSLWFLAVIRPEGLVLSFAMVGAVVLWKLFDPEQRDPRRESREMEVVASQQERRPVGDNEGSSIRRSFAATVQSFISAMKWPGWPIWTALALGLAPTILLAILSGHVTTNGMSVKSHLAHDMDWVRYLWETGRTIVAVPGRLVTSSNEFVSQILFGSIIIALAGLLSSDDRRRRAVAWIVGACLLAVIAFYGFVIEHVEHHNRYYMPYVPLVVGASAVGIDVVSRPFGDRLGRILRRTILVAILLFGAGSLGLWARIYARNCSDIAGHYLPMVAWMRNNIPRDAKVAIHDAGAIPYLSGRRCYDMIGLVSNEFRPPGGVRSDGFVWEVLERIRPGYMVVYPNFFPTLTRLPLLERVHSVPLAQVTIAGGREKTAYRVHWDRIVDADRPVLPPARAGWRLIDQVDVADQVSERAHRYHAGQEHLHGPARFRLAVMHRQGRLLIDGGRIIRSGEHFEIRGVDPHKPLALVLRSRMGGGGELEVSVAGRSLSASWLLGRGEDRTRAEAWYDVPESVLEGDRVEIRVSLLGGHEYEALHWFVLQP